MPERWHSLTTSRIRAQMTGGPKSKKGPTDPCQVLLPVDADACATARQTMANGDKHMVEVADYVSRDPIMVVEFLKTVNGFDFAAREGHVTRLLPALVRLGSQEVIQILLRLGNRPKIKDEGVVKWIELYRYKARRQGIIARILAELVVHSLREDCLAAGVMMPIGDMLAAAFLEEKYVSLAEQMPRAKLNYQLGQHHNFDVEKMTLRFLNRNGIPGPLVDALNLSAKIEVVERARSRTVCFAAAEMVEGYDSDKWDKFEPGRPLPPKSFVRSLYLSQKDYTTAYERTGRYLYEAMLAAKRAAQEEEGSEGENQPDETPT